MVKVPPLALLGEHLKVGIAYDAIRGDSLAYPYLENYTSIGVTSGDASQLFYPIVTQDSSNLQQLRLHGHAHSSWSGTLLRLVLDLRATYIHNT